VKPAVRRGAPRLAASVLAVLVALAAVVLLAGPAGAASAGPSEPSGRSDPGRPEQVAGTIELVDQTTWLDDGLPFDARVRITRPPAGATVRVAVHERLLNRTRFQETLDGDLGDTALEVQPVPVAMLPDRGAGTLGVGFETDGSAGAALEQGVYPVEIQMLDGGGNPVGGFVTYVVIRPPESPDFPPLAVSIVLDVGGPPSLQPDGTSAVSDETLDRIEERISVLEGTPGAPLTLAPEPETLDGLADVRGRGPEVLADLVAARGTRPVLARPYTDVDITSLMDAGAIAELNAQADGGANVVRTRLGVEPTPGIWLSSTTLGEPAAQMLVDLGVGRALVPPEAVGDVPGVEAGQIPAGTFTLGEGGPVTMVSDPTLSQHLAAGDGVLGAERFVAELAMMWLERPADPRGVVVRVPADAPLDTQLVETALAEMNESRVLSLTALDQLFATVPPVEGDAPPVAAPAPHQASSDLSVVARRVATARAQVGGYDDTVGGQEEGRSLADSLLLATGAETPNDQRDAYVDRVNGVLQDLRGLITAPSTFRITLTSRSGEIPLNLTNNSGRPVNVRITLESEQLEFPGGDVMTETLQPGGTPIRIPVRTRASGAFPLVIVVTSPDGSVVLERARFDIRSTAVSGVGVVLSIGAGLFLAIWWARHWRSTRRSRRLVPPEDIPEIAPPGTPARGIPAVGTAPRPPPPGPAPPAQPGASPPADPAAGRSPDPSTPAPPPEARADEDGYRPAHMAGNRPRRR
jgi:uncharacterized protein DUF6049